MALSVTRVPGAQSTFGNKKVRVFDLVFSGNYTTGGETFAPSTTNVGMRVFEQVLPHGAVATSTDLLTAIPVGYNYLTSKFLFYEGSAAGTALAEKTTAEVYPTGCKLRVTVIGV